MNIVSTSQFTIVDLNDSVFTPNLLPWSEDWVVGSGSLERWTAHGDAAENVRSIFVDPFGYKNVLWRCIPDADGGASGGFTIGGIRLKRDKTYRFTCFIKRSSTMGGTLTIGMGNVNSLAGIALSNAPVISFMTNVEPDTWYLLVGILHPAGTTSSIGKTGIYNMRGSKLIEGTEYAFGVTAEPTFYVKLDGATTAASEVQLFMPTLECLDGTEESIQTLIRYDGSENDYLRDVLEKGKTAIEGGLLTSNVILAAGLDGVVRSGMSGISEDNIGFFTGGTYDDAVNNKASNIIHKDGSVRLGAGAFAYDKASNRFNLGNFILLNDDIIGVDNGVERVRFSGGDVPSIDAIDQGWGYYAAGVYGNHPDSGAIPVELSPPSRKWVYANGAGYADRIMAFSISDEVFFTGSKQYRLDDVSIDAWIYNESADESTITATWGLYNVLTDVIVYPVGGPVSVSTPIPVTNSGRYKLKINVSPRIKISGVTPYQKCYFEAYFRCAGISQQGVHTRSLIGRDGIMSYYSATSYFYYKEAYGFEARFGGMGFRVSTSGIQKMVDGSTWVNDTLMNTSLASATALGIMRVGAGLSAVEGLVSISILEGTADLYRNVWFGQNTVSNSLAYDSDFVYNPALKTLQVGSTTVGRLMIGGGMLVWDNDNNALKVVSRDGTTTISLYATGSSAALGIGSGGGGGGGTSYNRLDTWDAYVPGTTDTWVLSALLGHDLHTRVTALEEDTPNVAWGVPTTDYVPLTVNAISRQLSIHGHGHTFASLASKPTTIAGYGITDSLIYEGDARLTNSRPASDVYAWAKASTKPSYSYSDVGAAAASHTHGNITNDGKIGSTANLVVVTGTAGALTAKTAGTTAQYLRGDGSWATPPDTVYVHPTKTERNVGGTAHFITAFTSDTLGHVTGITTAAMTKADVESVLTGNSITSHYHDDRYFQKGELFTKEGSGTEADPYRIKALFPFYGVSSVAALGIGSGGGGTAYDRLDTWASYDETKAGWVLGAALGYDLHSRVSTLESSTPNIAWGVMGSGYIPLTVNGASYQLSTHGHTHTKSSITDFPSSWDWSAIDNKPSTYTPSAHTHDDRYYTETEIGNLFAGTTAITGYNKSNWDNVYTAFNAMQVGGRNLIDDTKSVAWAITKTADTYLGFTVCKATKGTTGYTDIISRGTIQPAVSNTYVVSFYAKASVAGTILCYFYNPNTTTSVKTSTGYIGTGVDGAASVNITTNWERYWVVWEQSETTTVKRLIVGRNMLMPAGSVVEIAGVKLEEGNVATDWTPAPEDVDASIATVQTNLDTHAALTNNPHSVTKTQVGLSNVENTALSTWAGSGNITALGTIVSGTWNANTIAVTKGGTGKTSVAANSMLYASAANTYSEVATSSFGRGLLSAVSGTVVSGLNADKLDGRDYDGYILSNKLSAATQPVTYNFNDFAGNAITWLDHDKSSDGANVTYENAPWTTVPSGGWSSMFFKHSIYGTQLVFKYASSDINVRYKDYSGGAHWQEWGKLYSSHNCNNTSTDWSAKNLALAGSITGATTISASSTVSATTAILSNLTAGYVPYHTAGGLVNGPIYTNGTNVGIGTTSPSQKLDVAGNINFNTNGQNTLISNYKGANSDGYNIFIGGGGQSSIGESGATYKGSRNTAYGVASLQSLTTGSYNTAIGTDSLLSLTTGFRNTANGVYSLRFLTTGSYNTANGVDSGRYISSGSANRASTSSVFLGYDTRPLADGQTNQIVIGASAVGIGSNSVVLGNDSITKTALKGRVGIGTADPQDALDVNGNIRTSSTDGSYMQIGPIKLIYDATNNALRFEGNVYATGSNTAFGIGGGAGGGGLITNVYGTSGFGGSYSDVDLSSTFNAYAINSLYTALQGKAASDHTHAAASATASGIVTTGAQTFAGAKTFANGIKISSEMAVQLLGGAPYLYSNEQGEAIMTFDNGQIKVTHHWESIFEGAVSTGALTASTISTGDVAFKVQKLTRQLSPSDISNGMYQFSGAHANPSKVVFIGCQVYQASNGSLYGDTLSGDGEYFLHPVAAYNNNINVYFESADNSLSPDDTLVLFLIYTL